MKIKLIGRVVLILASIFMGIISYMWNTNNAVSTLKEPNVKYTVTLVYLIRPASYIKDTQYVSMYVYVYQNGKFATIEFWQVRECEEKEVPDIYNELYAEAKVVCDAAVEKLGAAPCEEKDEDAEL